MTDFIIENGELRNGQLVSGSMYTRAEWHKHQRMNAIRRLLEQAQWAAHASPSGDASESSYCFECGGFEPSHEDGCSLKAAIDWISGK